MRPRTALIYGTFLGAAMMLFLAILFAGALGPLLGSAQLAYTRCITDGAPKESCLETYLLPEEKP